ncbi:MAG: hypothetical protein V3S41_02045 [Spirochaetia bacterium]
MKERQGVRAKPRAGYVVIALVFGILIAVPVVGDNESPSPALDPDERFDPATYTVGWLTSDRDNDGRVDYAVRVDERGYKLREVVDFNLDGRMDDFYFYSNDVLQRQEVDSNFDQAIDIWIFMWRGVYVQRWERDTDYDGAVDQCRDYDEPR